jgi:hypothetical protein
MHTPTPTPRTDAATHPADCLGTTLVTNRDCARALERELGAVTGTYTCTHHSDQQRTACPVCLVTALTAERDQLRAVFPLICAAIGNGACCTPTVSVGFIESIPNEVQLVVDQLRADCENETKWAAHYLAESIAVKAERDQLRAEAERLKFYIATTIQPHEHAKVIKGLRDEAERTDAIYQRACEVEQELRAGLAAEREKVRVLREVMVESHDSGELTGYHLRRARATLIATEEGAK